MATVNYRYDPDVILYKDIVANNMKDTEQERLMAEYASLPSEARAEKAFMEQRLLRDWREEFANKESSNFGYKEIVPEFKIPLTPRQLLAEAQENKVKQERRAIENSDLEYRILEQLNREFDNLKENADSLTVGDRLAVLKQLTTLVSELQ